MCDTNINRKRRSFYTPPFYEKKLDRDSLEIFRILRLQVGNRVVPIQRSKWLMNHP
jgi:hypothetical protein